jgi:hypothetical protein
MPVIPVTNLSSELPEGATPITLRWFRHGVEPSGIAVKRLAEHLNILMAQRGRTVLCHSGVFRQDANAGSGPWKLG